jgi:glycosyltransferase involved in cell wall biosynthesis
MSNEPLVSITCITYNHENYIADAIESFLMQKTNFPYEILIHDDASSDRTPEIIKEYEAKYPDIIKPIYQTENQHSKGVKVSRFNLERAKGKYIATCEGDDYWTDPYKLQKQVDYMQKNPKCSLCVHAAYRIRPDRTKLKTHLRPSLGNKAYTVDEVILGGGGLFATNSMLYPAVFNNNRPKFFENAPIGDYPLAIYLAMHGTVYYIDEFMSAYRVGAKGSWSESISKNIENRVVYFEKRNDMLNEIDRYSKYKHTNTIKKAIELNSYGLLSIQVTYGEVKNEEIFLTLKNKKNMAKLFIKKYFPGIIKALINVKRNLAR